MVALSRALVAMLVVAPALAGCAGLGGGAGGAFIVPASRDADEWTLTGAAFGGTHAMRAAGVKPAVDEDGRTLRALMVRAPGFLPLGEGLDDRELAFALDGGRLILLNASAPGGVWIAAYASPVPAAFLSAPFLRFALENRVLHRGDTFLTAGPAGEASWFVKSADAKGATLTYRLPYEAVSLSGGTSQREVEYAVRVERDRFTLSVPEHETELLAELTLKRSNGTPVEWKEWKPARSGKLDQSQCTGAPADGNGGPAFPLSEAVSAAKSRDGYRDFERREGPLSLVQATLDARAQVSLQETWTLDFSSENASKRWVATVVRTFAGPRSPVYLTTVEVESEFDAAPAGPSLRPSTCLTVGAALGRLAEEMGSDRVTVSWRWGAGLSEESVPVGTSPGTETSTWVAIVGVSSGLQRTLVLSAATGARLGDRMQQLGNPSGANP